MCHAHEREMFTRRVDLEDETTQPVHATGQRWGAAQCTRADHTRSAPTHLQLEVLELGQVLHGVLVNGVGQVQHLQVRGLEALEEGGG